MTGEATQRAPRYIQIWATALAVLATVLLVLDLTDREEEARHEPARLLPEPPARRVAAEPATAAVNEYLAFVRGSDVQVMAGRDHAYTSAGLRKLATALDSLRNRETATAVGPALAQTASELRRTADVLQRDPSSTQHADSAREAFLSLATAIDALQQASYPDLAEHVGRLREAAEAVDPGELLLEQKERVLMVFQTAGDVLGAMTKPPGGGAGGL